VRRKAGTKKRICSGCGKHVAEIHEVVEREARDLRFEEAVGQACESAAASQVARRFGLAASTIRAIDMRYLTRWEAARRKPALKQMGIDEIYLGKSGKFITVVSNLETGEPVWFGQERERDDR
jgi:transposase